MEKKGDCTIYVAKRKALISFAVTAKLSFAVTAKLMCVFVFAYAKRWFSGDAAHFCNSEVMASFPHNLVLDLHH